MNQSLRFDCGTDQAPLKLRPYKVGPNSAIINKKNTKIMENDHLATPFRSLISFYNRLILF